MFGLALLVLTCSGSVKPIVKKNYRLIRFYSPEKLSSKTTKKKEKDIVIKAALCFGPPTLNHKETDGWQSCIGNYYMVMFLEIINFYFCERIFSLWKRRLPTRLGSVIIILLVLQIAKAYLCMNRSPVISQKV